jgi:UDP-3-O-[3-hydroxymyristoyl] N-acetylglucosamine deacetylase/3-hydroxyacyl-[acyl-carrier-protein] dehydratase
VLNQQTLREPVSYSGIGLHSGNRVKMTFLPAPPHSGIRFRRVDLEGKPEIEAIVDHVADTTRSTTLAKGNIRIHTVEHILATFAGCEVDNAIVELDANEPPIADGSSRVYTKLIRDAGVVPQPEKREPFALREPVAVNAGETTLNAFPHDRLKITCTSADAGGRHTQCYSVEINPETWAREVASARTFCFFEEIEQLYRNGLIKGGGLENAIVIRDDAVLTNEPLRYPEEFVRHKILDILGDLALIGRPLHAHIVAVKTNHTANCELARQVAQQMRRPLQAARAFAPPPAPVPAPAADGAAPATPGAVMDINDILRILPHKYPFLMVDRVTRLEQNRIVGLKNVTINEPFFQGHFPGHPIMPGVLQLEAMAQLAGILALKLGENLGKVAYFMSADGVKWRKPVLPGDVLEIDFELLRTRGKIIRGRGQCRVAGEVVSEGEISFILVDPNEPAR